MSQCLDLNQFLQAPGVILDVRSPAEFAHAHIPGAHSLPLFTDAERALVGTCYKQKGRDEAVHLGLTLVGGKFASMVTQAKDILAGQPAKVHCWRGGLRSASVAWLLETAGIPTVTLKGGYKAFRGQALKIISELENTPVRVLGGLTGTGKTEILHALRTQGHQVLDLEGIASHRGSSYGMLGLPSQPSCEQFENEIAFQCGRFDSSRPVWVEDESRMIGHCKIPDPLFSAMQKAPIIVVKRPLSERLAQLLEVYGKFPSDQLVNATLRIRKKLGGAATQEICELLQQGNMTTAFEKILAYYDRAYVSHLEGRQHVYPLLHTNLSSNDWALAVAGSDANHAQK